MTKLISWISLCLLLSACAGLTPEATQEKLAPPPATEPQEPLPDVALEPEVLYDILVGEIAGHRGQIDIASTALARAARTTGDPRLAERATMAALFAKHYEEALEAAQLWVDLRPKNVEAHEALGGALLELNRLAEARVPFEKLLALEAQRGTLDQGYLRVAAVLGRAQNRKGAALFMQELVALNPRAAAAHFAHAHLAVRLGDLADAAKAADRALALKPDWQEAALFKARILVSQKDGASAQTFFEEYLREQPAAGTVRLHYARYLIDQKQWEKARDQFKRVISESPTDADAIYAVGLLSLQTNRLDEAETYLKRTIELRPQNDQARIYLGQVAEQQKRYPEARQWYEAVPEGEHFFEAQTRIAVLIARQGELERARAHLHSIEAESDQQEVQLVLAEDQMLRDAKRYPESLEVLNDALGRLPEEKDLLYARALIGEKLDDMKLVETDLRAILKQDPKNVNALNALGYTLADRTVRYSEAQALLTQALELKPEDPFVLDSMGWLHYRTGNNDEAIKLLKRALTIRSDAEIAAHLGEVLWVTGDRGEAESVWTRALRETPDNEALLGVINKFKEKNR